MEGLCQDVAIAAEELEELQLKVRDIDFCSHNLDFLFLGRTFLFDPFLFKRKVVSLQQI